MLGLQSAAPSMAYSLVKVAPSNSIRTSESWMVGIKAVSELVGVPTERAREVAVTSVEADDDVVQRRPHLVFGQGEDALEHHARSGLLKLEALLAGHEQLGDHPRWVGRHPLRVAGDESGMRRSHCETGEKRCACCMVEITATVDSAP